MKGDRVEVLIDAGNGQTRSWVIEATKAGRRVEVSMPSGNRPVEVVELTRSGRPVRLARFMASRIVAIVEQSAEPPARTPRTDRGEPLF
jgi:hypothetical protein